LNLTSTASTVGVGLFFTHPTATTSPSPHHLAPSCRNPAIPRPSPLQRDVGRFIYARRMDPAGRKETRGDPGRGGPRGAFSSVPLFLLWLTRQNPHRPTPLSANRPTPQPRWQPHEVEATALPRQRGLHNCQATTLRSKRQREESNIDANSPTTRTEDTSGQSKTRTTNGQRE